MKLTKAQERKEQLVRLMNARAGVMTCPWCQSPVVTYGGGYRCAGSDSPENGSHVCCWSSKDHPEYDRGYNDGQNQAETTDREGLKEKYNSGLERGRAMSLCDLVQEAIEKTRRVYNEEKDVVEDVVIPPDPAKVEEVMALALAFADQLAAGVVKAEKNFYGTDRDKRLERLLHPATDYLAVRLTGKPASDANTELLNQTPEQKEEKRRKARYTITLTVEGARLETIRKKADEAFGTELKAVQKVEHATSRGARLDEAMRILEDAKSEVESLRDEMQEWHDNLPESFQQGQKGEQLEEAVTNLETVIEELDGATSAAENVEFPGMY